MDLKELLEKLHEETAKALLEKIKNGEAKPGDFQVAISLLKHNKIYVNPDRFKDDPIALLEKELKEVEKEYNDRVM